MNFTPDQWPEPIRRRMQGAISISPTADALRQAAWERERAFAGAVLNASTGGDCDVDELLDLGARCGLAPVSVYAALRSAEVAHAAWQASVHRAVFRHHC